MAASNRFQAEAVFLPASFFNFRAALADLETWIALADHVDAAASLDDLAIGMAVFQRADAADNFHRIDLYVLIV